ncbi:hypothetical protein F5B22DRAFT_648556 [Xylaria bambusicola]|uniref:uncharacterized protein n=1 Tax=Xylaria bambusicola TaxID=326684 RepID=UPI0020087DF5|nr:uncharacterized protein F5B22DRAFT_648556 [Xylaria bambusicola]KAI0512451.1 hypothetical protein F5B22DRAFT_648556 [Xylaria bambusicola]
MSSSSGSPGRRPEVDSAGFNWRSEMDTSIDFDEAAGIATFPFGNRYSIRELLPGSKNAVTKALKTSSKLSLRGCSARGQSYVFLISETIEHHVRAPYGGGPYDGPSCTCRQDERSVGLQHPCRHTLWLCDQILSQLVPLQSDPHSWREDGYTTKHGNVCDFISDFHFDVLADSLRCDIVAGESSGPRPHRIQTAREVLATLSGSPVDQYRPDLTSESEEKTIVKEGDLEATIFRMLLQSDSLLSYFLALMRDHERLNPRFRRFRDRADSALEAFDKYIKASDLRRVELSKDPQWCYKTFKDISKQIRSIILYSERDLDASDRRAAASTLVYILDQVVSRNEDHEVRRGNPDEGQLENSRKINLCKELIVESSHDFILDILDELQESVSHLLPELDRIERVLANTNVPASYCNKLRDIIIRLRSVRSRVESGPTESSRKRTSHDGDRPPKRVK